MSSVPLPLMMPCSYGAISDQRNSSDLGCFWIVLFFFAGIFNFLSFKICFSHLNVEALLLLIINFI